MGTPQLFDIFPAIFNGVGGSFTLNHLENVDANPGLEQLLAMAGGSVDPQFLATATAEPTAKFTTRDLAQLLNGCPMMVGKRCTAASLQFQRRVHGGTYDGTNVHVNLTATAGILYIEEFGAEQDSKQGADASVQFVATYDGANYPLVANVNQALTGSPAVNSVYALGPVFFEGAQLPGVTKVRVKTGIEIQQQRADGETVSRICVIQKRAPTIEIEALNLGILATTGTKQLPIDDGLTCFFQHCIFGGERYPANATEHISVAASQGVYKIENISGSAGSNATMRLTASITNNQIAAAVGVAIA